MPSSRKNKTDYLLEDAPKLRKCHLYKLHASQDYGFDLHADKTRGQFIGSVDSNSPAELAGLHKGDRIVAVNGVPITPQEHHAEVVKRIKENPLECNFLLIDEAGFSWFNSRKMAIPLDNEVEDAAPTGPLAENFNDDKAINASLSSQKEEINVINGDAPCKNGNIICDEISCTFVKKAAAAVGVSGESPTMNDDCVASLTELSSPQSLHYSEGQSNGLIFDTVVDVPSPIEIIPANMRQDVDMQKYETESGSPDCQLPRLCRLEKTHPNEEYGFNLHAEKNKGHFIGKVDDESPAQRAGLVQSWRIVGVNQTLIHQKTPHKEVVALIKKDPSQTQLLIVSPELDAMYAEQRKEFSFDDAELYPRSQHDETLRELVNGSVVSVTNETDSKSTETRTSIAADKVNEMSEHANNNGEIISHIIDGVGVRKMSITEQKSETNEDFTSGSEEQNAPSNGNIDSHTGKDDTVDIFQMSASQMRERVSRHKKVDPRKESMPLRTKYNIIQNL